MQPHRFTVDDYHRMVEVGVLDPDERVELLHGEVVEMTPIGPLHASTVSRLARVLIEATGPETYVSPQNPASIDLHSEPEPDLVLARPDIDRYREAHPGPDDVLLLVEVADTSLEMDRNVKLPLYAKAGIVEVWIVDVNENGVEVCRDPSGGEYRDVRRFKPGDSITLHALSDVTVEVSDFLG
jgi:Uma2 family endonuclease